MNTIAVAVSSEECNRRIKDQREQREQQREQQRETHDQRVQRDQHFQ